MYKHSDATEWEAAVGRGVGGGRGGMMRSSNTTTRSKEKARESTQKATTHQATPQHHASPKGLQIVGMHEQVRHSMHSTRKASGTRTRGGRRGSWRATAAAAAGCRGAGPCSSCRQVSTHTLMARLPVHCLTLPGAIGRGVTAAAHERRGCRAGGAFRHS